MDALVFGRWHLIDNSWHVDLVGDGFGIERMGRGENQKWVKSVRDAILSRGIILKSLVEEITLLWVEEITLLRLS